jgi:hypothetical protein
MAQFVHSFKKISTRETTMRKIFGALLACITFGVAGAAGAGVINFTYTGTDPLCATCSETGVGSFSFADSPTSLSLGDLTAFSLVISYTDTSPPPISLTFIYGLGDLLSFAATLDSAQNLTALSFETIFVYESSCGFFCTRESLNVTSLDSAKTSTCNDLTKGGCVDVVFPNTQGFLTTSIPEPSTIALLSIAFGFTGIGYAGLGYERLKRRRAAA